MENLRNIVEQLRFIKSDLFECKIYQRDIYEYLNEAFHKLSIIEEKIHTIRKRSEYPTLKNIDVINNIEAWIKSFDGNHNTGNHYEIKVGISFLEMAGLDKIQKTHPYFVISNPSIYEKKNGCDKMIGLYNLSQKDTISGTSDIGIVYNSGKMQYYSITKWSGSFNKCMCNPSPVKTYNMEKYISYIESETKNVFIMSKKYLAQTYGKTPNAKWKRKKISIVTQFIQKLAELASYEWNLFPVDRKLCALRKILDLSIEDANQSMGVIFFDKKDNKIRGIYKWKLIINLVDYLDSTCDGIYIYHHKNNNRSEWIIRTQAKYNNGAIEGLNERSQWKIKPGKPVSSWNCVANMKKIFDLSEVKLEVP